MARSGGCALLLAAVLFSAGCVAQRDTHGEPVDPEKLLQLRPGVQTKDDVARLLGSPASTSVFDRENWYYISDTEERFSVFEREFVERQVVIITFDQRGVVTGVDAFGRERGREVELVTRETPSFGESVSFLDQVMSNLGRFNSAGGQQQRGGRGGGGSGIPGSPGGGL